MLNQSLLVGLLVASLTCGSSSPGMADSGSAESKASVGKATSVVDGSRVAMDQHGNSHGWLPEAGAITLVDFAASWCGPCRETLPKLQRFAESHPEVRVLVISVDEQKEGRDALVADLQLKVPVLWDQGHRAAEHYRPGGMPSTFLFDATGEQVLSYVGSSKKDWQKLVRQVESLSP